MIRHRSFRLDAEITSFLARPDLLSSFGAHVARWPRLHLAQHSRSPTAKGFRSDIEGLRGVAVLAVLLFHLGIPQIGGGFLGVDIFFVISGFLITGIIQRDIDQSCFFLRSFFRRRFARLAPAFLVMLTATSLICWAIFLPRDLSRLGEYLASSATYMSNLDYAFRTTGYFSTAAARNPLLHTWSLSVEEQFYLGLPLLLMIWPKRIDRRWLHLTLFLASFGLTIWLGAREKAYFLTPFRFWEFAAGALVASTPLTFNSAFRKTLGVIGLVLMIGSLLIFDGDAPPPFPSPALCVLGVCCLLGGHADDPANAFLNLRLLRFLGRISYSLYLWHWPIVVLVRYVEVTPLGPVSQIAVLVATILVADLSWNVLEKPQQLRTQLFSRSKHQLYLVTLSLCLVAVGIGLANGTLRRAVPDISGTMEASADDAGRFHRCLESGGRPCLLGDPKVPPSFILWGDSHAVSLAEGLDTVAKLSGRSGVLMAVNSCPPMTGVLGWWPSSAARCAQANAEAIARSRDLTIKTIVLAALWERALVAPTDGRTIWLEDLRRRFTSGSARLGIFKERVLATFKAISRPGLEIIVVGNVPSAVVDVPHGYAIAQMLGTSPVLGQSRDAFEAFTITEAPLRQLAAQEGVRFIAPADMLCPHGLCRVAESEALLYFDQGHLNARGSRRFAMDGHILRP